MCVRDSIRMITEAGLVQHWLNEEIGSVPQCLRPPSADRSDGIAALNLESFGGPLLVLAAGEGSRKFEWKQVIIINKLKHIFMIPATSDIF